MSLVEETDVTPGSESIALSQDPIQASIVEKKVYKAKPEFRNSAKGQRWKKIFDFDQGDMSPAQVKAEQDKRRKKVIGGLKPGNVTKKDINK